MSTITDAAAKKLARACYALWKGGGDIRPFPPTSVLIVELTKIGDVISTTPTIGAIRRAFPDARVAVAVEEPFKDLVSHHPAVDEVVSVAECRGLRGLKSLIARIRDERYQIVMNCSPSKRNTLTVALSGAPYRVGYLDFYSSMTPFLHDHEISCVGFRPPERLRFKAGENLAVRGLRAARALGCSERDTHLDIAIPDRHKEEVKGLMRSWGLRADAPHVVMHSCTGWVYRNWPVPKVAAFASRLQERYDADIVLIGSEEDRYFIEGVERAMKTGPTVLLGLPLLTLCALIGEADFFVGMDSGPLHIAAALNVPVLGMFGCAPSSTTGPMTYRGTMIDKGGPCSPCDQQRCLRPFDPCMHRIEIEEVLGAFDHVYRKYPIPRK